MSYWSSDVSILFFFTFILLGPISIGLCVLFHFFLWTFRSYVNLKFDFFLPFGYSDKCHFDHGHFIPYHLVVRNFRFYVISDFSILCYIDLGFWFLFVLVFIPLTSFGAVYCYNLRSPKGGCCSISDDLSCSWIFCPMLIWLRTFFLYPFAFELFYSLSFGLIGLRVFRQNDILTFGYFAQRSFRPSKIFSRSFWPSRSLQLHTFRFYVISTLWLLDLLFFRPLDFQSDVNSTLDLSSYVTSTFKPLNISHNVISSYRHPWYYDLQIFRS